MPGMLTTNPKVREPLLSPFYRLGNQHIANSSLAKVIQLKGGQNQDQNPGFLTSKTVPLTCKYNNPLLNGKSNLVIGCTSLSKLAKAKHIHLFKVNVDVDMAVRECLEHFQA